MKFTKYTVARRGFACALVAGAIAAAATRSALAENKNANVKIGVTPKFLQDDFHKLMLDMCKEAFAKKGFTVVGAPDPNGESAAQVDARQNLLSNGAKVLVFAPIGAAGVMPAVKRANDVNALVFSIDDGPSGGKATATARVDNVSAFAAAVIGGVTLRRRPQRHCCGRERRSLDWSDQ